MGRRDLKVWIQSCSDYIPYVSDEKEGTLRLKRSVTHPHTHTGTLEAMLPLSGQQSPHSEGSHSLSQIIKVDFYKNSTLGTLHLFEVQRPLKNKVHHWGGKTFCKGEWQGSVASRPLILFFSTKVVRTWPVPGKWLGQLCKHSAATTRHTMRAIAKYASTHTTVVTVTGMGGSRACFHEVPLCITSKNELMLHAHNHIFYFGGV